MTDENLQHQNQNKFAEEMSSLLNFTLKQQQAFQQKFQANLNLASTSLADSKLLQKLYKNAQLLQQAAELGISNLQINIDKYRQMIEEMEKDCHRQQISADMEAVHALHQAISAMANAQNSLLHSQTVDKMFDSIIKCQDTLAEIEKLNKDISNKTAD